LTWSGEKNLQKKKKRSNFLPVYKEETAAHRGIAR